MKTLIAVLSFTLAAGCGRAVPELDDAGEQEIDAGDSPSPDAGAANTNSYRHALTIPFNGNPDKIGCPLPNADCAADTLPEHDVYLDSFKLEARPVTDEDGGAVHLDYDDATAECARIGGKLPTDAQLEKGEQTKVHVPELEWARDWYDENWYARAESKGTDPFNDTPPAGQANPKRAARLDNGGLTPSWARADMDPAALLRFRCVVGP